MPFTNTIVGFINDQLKVGTLSASHFQPAKFYNVASAIMKDEMTFPGVIDKDGEVESVSPDDLFHLSIYHKVLGNGYGVQKKGSYGDGNDIVSSTEMQLFVFAQSNKIRLSPEQLEPYIVFGIPDQITAVVAGELKLKACTITPVSSDMDKIRNFRNEFQGVAPFLAPEHIFFSVRYTIKKLFDRACFDYCMTCDQQLN